MSLDVAQVASSVDWKDRALASGKATSLFLTVLLLIGSCVAQADEKTTGEDTKGIAFFESKIRPVLVQHCCKCHSVGAGKSEGGRLLDSRKTFGRGEIVARLSCPATRRGVCC